MTDKLTDAPTPRTDNEDHWFVDRDESGLLGVDTVRADFARELERELAECRAALCNVLDSRIAEAKAMNRLNVALENYSDCREEAQEHLRALVVASNAEHAASAIVGKGE